MFRKYESDIHVPMYIWNPNLRNNDVRISGTCPNMIDANGFVSTNVKGTLIDIRITVVALESTKAVTLTTLLIFRYIQIIMTFPTLT